MAEDTDTNSTAQAGDDDGTADAKRGDGGALPRLPGTRAAGATQARRYRGGVILSLQLVSRLVRPAFNPATRQSMTRIPCEGKGRFEEIRRSQGVLPCSVAEASWKRRMKRRSMRSLRVMTQAPWTDRPHFAPIAMPSPTLSSVRKSCWGR